VPMSIPMAMGRSKEAGIFFQVCGRQIKYASTRRPLKARLAKARSIRWVLSLTAASGSPTRMVLGSPAATSTFHFNGIASIPTSAKVLVSQASEIILTLPD